MKRNFLIIIAVVLTILLVSCGDKGATYNLIFDTDGGSYISSIAVKPGEAVPIPENPIKEGHSFIGWDNEIPTTMINKEFIFKAFWKVNEYTITFNTNGGTSIAPITKEYDTVLQIPSEPTRVGYKFIKWDMNFPKYMPGRDLVITAIWETTSGSIIFETNGGTIMTQINANIGTPLSAPADPVRAGYTFLGWDKAFPSSMLAGTLVLTAEWEMNNYIITFDSNEGSIVAPIEGSYLTIASLETPKREGYAFIAWTDGNTQYYDTITIDNNLRLKALWTVDTDYEITFDSQFGDLIEPMIIPTYGTIETLPVIGEVDGNFVGWTYNGELVETPFRYTFEEDITLVAQWQNFSNGVFYSIFYNEVQINGYYGDDSVVRLPNEIDGYRVTSISNNAFRDNTTIEQLFIGEFTHTIGDSAFYGMSNLKNIEFPNGAQKIGISILEGASNLENITLSSELNHNLIYYFDNNYNTDLIPDTFNTVTYANGGSYINQNLTSNYFSNITLILAKDTVEVDNYQFQYHHSLSNIVIPEGVTKIGQYAFYASGINKIELPESLISLGENALSSMWALQLIEISVNNNYYQTIDGVLYSKDATKLIAYPAGSLSTEYILPSSVNTISGNTFSSSNNLTVINLGENNLTTIDAYAFNETYGLRELIIPSSVTYIDNYAFENTSFEIYTSFEKAPSSWHNNWNYYDNIVHWGFDGIIDDGILSYLTFADGTAYVAGLVAGSEETNIVIPEYIDGYRVIEISDRAFMYNNTINSISIASTIKIIGREAFYNSSQLNEIIFDNNSELEVIEEWAFYNIWNLQEITIPKSVKTIGNYAFSYLNNLKKIKISDDSNLEVIGEWAFAGNNSGASFHIPNKVIISSYAFQDSNIILYTSLESQPETWSEYWNDSNNIVYWGYYGSDNDDVLEYALFTDGTAHVVGLVEGSEETNIVIPESINGYEVVKISDNAFRHNGIITSVLIANTIKYIGNYSFSNTYNLIKVEFDNASKLERIGDWAFGDSANIEKVQIPSSVLSVGDSAFQNTNVLLYSSLELQPETWSEYWNASNNIVYWGYYGSDNDGVLEYILFTDGTAHVVGLVEGSEETNIVIPKYIDGYRVVKISDGAFRSNNTINSISIASTIKIIGREAFYSSSQLSKIVFDNNSELEVIEDFAFYNLNNLIEITIPNSVTKIGSHAFSHSLNIKTIKIDEGSNLETIGEYAFSYNSKLVSFEIPSSVIKIGNYVFENMNILLYSSLESQPESWSEYWNNRNHIVYWGYYGNDNDGVLEYILFIDGTAHVVGMKEEHLQSNIIIPNNINGYIVTNINDSAFAHNKTINNVHISNTIKKIGKNAFYYNENLITITFEEDSQLEVISEMAFYNSHKIKTVQLPNSVVSIGNYAFAYLYELTSFTIGEDSKLTTIGYGAFSSTNNLISFHIPNSITYMDSAVFQSSNVTIYTEHLEAPLSWHEYWITTKQNIVWGYMGLVDDGILEYIMLADQTAIVKGMLDGVNEADITIPSDIDGYDVTKVNNRAFINNEYIRSIYISDSIKTIGREAFAMMNNLNSIMFGENSELQIIDDHGIYNNNQLKNLLIPNSVKSIGDYSLAYNYLVTDFGFNNDSLLTTIGHGAFTNSSSISEIIIPKTVTYIGDYAFENTSVVIYTELLEEPMDWAHSWNYDNQPVVWGTQGKVDDDILQYSLSSNGEAFVLGFVAGVEVDKLTIPKTINGYNVTHIVGEAFRNNYFITSVTIPNSIIKIGDNSFSELYNLTEVIFEEGSKLEHIGSSAFSNASSLTTIDIPNSVKVISQYAFAYNSALKSVNFGEESMLTTINYEAFTQASQLTHFIIPKYVVQIDNGFLSHTYSLTNIEVAKDNMYYKVIDGVLFNIDGTNLIYYPKGNLRNEYTVPEGVMEISYGAFSEAVNLEIINIADSVVTINGYAFSNMPKLSVVDFNEESKLEYIAYGVFNNSSLITNFKIPKNVSTIDNSAFHQMQGLLKFELAEGNKYYDVINGVLFTKDLTKLIAYPAGNTRTEYAIPAGVITIEYYVFNQANNLEVITIPNTVISIEGQAFYQANNLESIIFEEGSMLQSIGYYAFGYNSLSTFTIPLTVSYIGYNAFEGNYGLVIYTSITKQPLTWDKDWNSNNHEVIWGH